MSHLERLRRGKRTYFYLATTVRQDGRFKKLRIFLGEHPLPARHAAAERTLREKVTALRRTDPLNSLLTRDAVKKIVDAKQRYRRFLRKGGWEPFYDHFAAELTYNTNAIEGSTLTFLDTLMILKQGRVPEGKTIREVREAENHKAALDFLVSYRGGLTKVFILKLHKMLMHNILWRQAGRFRDIQVRVGNHYPPPPSAVPEALSKLMRWYIGNRNRYHPVVVAGYFHATFERIHLFRDGNGRVGRLLLNCILQKAGLPLVNIPVIQRKRYYASLQAADTGNLKPLIRLITERLLAEQF